MVPTIRPHRAGVHSHAPQADGGATFSISGPDTKASRLRPRRRFFSPAVLFAAAVLAIAASSLLWLDSNPTAGEHLNKQRTRKQRREDGRSANIPRQDEGARERRKHRSTRKRKNRGSGTREKNDATVWGREKAVDSDANPMYVKEKTVNVKKATADVKIVAKTEAKRHSKNTGTKRGNFPIVAYLERDDNKAETDTQAEGDASPRRTIRHRNKPDDDAKKARKQNSDEATATGAETRTIEVSKSALKAQKHLLNSKKYEHHMRDPLREGDCVPMQPWQETSFPHCSVFHELDPTSKLRTGELKMLNGGGYNQIYYFRPGGVGGKGSEDFGSKSDDDGSEPIIMKVLNYDKDYTDRNFDRVRRDALIMERLSPSPYVLDTFGHCGFAVLVPFAKDGTLSDELHEWTKGRIEISPMQRLTYAAEASRALADVHSIDKDQTPAVAHGDLKTSQYLLFDSESNSEAKSLRLADFNRGRFLRRNSTAPADAVGLEASCTYTIGQNDAKFRAPEEYKYVPETSAIDIWAMGSILYELLTKKGVWAMLDDAGANEKTMAGELPPIDETFRKSGDPVDEALIKGIEMCYIYEPEKRSTAEAVAKFLETSLKELKQSKGQR